MQPLLSVVNALQEKSRRTYLLAGRLGERWGGAALFAAGLMILQLSTLQPAEAAQGGEIFQRFACSLLGDVLTRDYGAMLSAVAGLLAIMASVMGSFKAAWALVFVTVGTFIYPTIVEEMFPLGCGGGGGG